MLAKVRPVGGRVYQSQDAPVDIPWKANYQHIYTNSGTAALSLAVAAAMQAKASSVVGAPEVILPAYACPDLVAALIAQGASPVLVDFEAGSFFLDLGKLQQALTGNTVAIVAVNFLGMYERLHKLREIADAQGVMLIEDSAQAPVPLSAEAAYADFAILSYGRGKPVNLMGGGALLFKPVHSELISGVTAGLVRSQLVVNWVWKLKALIVNTLVMRYPYGVLERIPLLNIGATTYHPLQYIEVREGMDQLVSVGLKHFYAIREAQVAAYAKGLAELQNAGWKLVVDGEANDVSRKGLLRFPILAPTRATRDHLELELNRLGYGANAFYRVPLPEIEGINMRLKNGRDDFPAAKEFADRLLTLPCHEGITVGEIDEVIDVVKTVAKLAC
ncbi:DegT/DnrJ/EryC1/StrS family aminotransferase [Hahella aquimaris]|uniref:DegT/DnrJ/EryC1/StrS family aminotransferase n=1 Tax=Hahella sp. HNIBRBA332 TaxID=3015983 RepID=UPI00273AE41E|nr:DegT/DnrJ/EryC1/StrS family aminotransferase [Hahella sp. HNIBRBA332]WLQ16843.1 DegT/DnrJ/EryC1/StrS family aminotransferase [Hahella sp. HNIBRBA332]